MINNYTYDFTHKCDVLICSQLVHSTVRMCIFLLSQKLQIMSDSPEKKLEEFMCSVDNRLRDIEKGLSESRFAQERRSEDSIPPTLGLVGGSNPPFLSPTTATAYKSAGLAGRVPIVEGQFE
ncbi:hypothetical protein ACF0H5_012887 [Mactra antiquata]